MADHSAGELVNNLKKKNVFQLCSLIVLVTSRSGHVAILFFI